MRAGFIGLGDQGGPMARRLVESGIPTTVWARRAEVATAYEERGAAVAASPAELGAASDVVAVCVFDAAGVEEVLFGPDGVADGLRQGGTILVHSTVSPAEIQGIAAKAAVLGLSVVDAPVSGGGRAAAAGDLLVMIAGPDDACAAVRPVLETYAGKVVRCGQVGSGQAAKLVNNAVFAANIATVYDALGLAEELGIGAAALEVVRGASGRSYAADVVAAIGSASRLVAGQFGAAIDKDLALLAATSPAGTGSRVIGVARDFMTASRETAAEDSEGAGHR